MYRPINADDGRQIRQLRVEICERYGEPSATVFLEAIGNVRDHCPRKRCRLTFLAREWRLIDRGPGIETEQSSQATAREEFGEGGYGLQLIRALGGQIISGVKGTTVLWQSPPSPSS